MTNGEVDQASWRRYATNNQDRCFVCGNRAAVSVTLSARPMGQKGGTPMVVNTWLFCNDHGLMRYGEAQIRLNGGQVPKATDR